MSEGTAGLSQCEKKKGSATARATTLSINELVEEGNPGHDWNRQGPSEDLGEKTP